MTRQVSVPSFNLAQDKQLPAKVFRHTLARPVYKRRICRDNRVYDIVPFTIQGEIATGDYGPQWAAHRDFWIARLTAEVGVHDTDTHPNDGTPSGSRILINMRRVSEDGTSDVPVLNSDSRLAIDIDHHRDAINDGGDGKAAQSDFNVTRLAEGDALYPRISQVGSGRPGTRLVISAVLVPIP